MLLVFHKIHALKFEEELSYKYMFGQLSKDRNITEISFNYSACINGRFEHKLQKFIDKLPFVYFSITVLIHNDKRNNTGKSLNSNMQFAQGKCVAKKVKHAILLDSKLQAAKL